MRVIYAIMAVCVAMALLFLFLFLMTLVAPLRASTLDVCVAKAELARSVMEAHQMGIPLERVYPHISDDVRGLVLQAYAKPRYVSKGFQRQEIDAFGNKVFAECVKS